MIVEKWDNFENRQNWPSQNGQFGWLFNNVLPFQIEHPVRNRNVTGIALAFLLIFSRDETQHFSNVHMRISQTLQEGSNWRKIAFFQKICDKFSCQGIDSFTLFICIRYLVKASLSRNSFSCSVWEQNDRSSFPSFLSFLNYFRVIFNFLFFHLTSVRNQN